MMKNLLNKVAVVTGSGNGIGKAIALAMSREGARVVVVDIDLAGAERVQQEIVRNGGECLVVRADVSDKKDVLSLFSQTLSTFGQIDILVNNVGTTIRKPMIEFTEEEWDSIMDVNLKSVFLCSQQAGMFMLKQKSGVVINISSIQGLGGVPKRIPYATSKTAIISFTKTLGCEWAGDGVRVNAIAPGYILTEGMAHALEMGILNREDMERRTPQGRLGTPEDVAEMAVFLASDKASYITGTTIYVDGGYSSYNGPEATSTISHNLA